MTGRPLVVGVADLLRRSGSHREERLEALLDDLAVSGSAVPDGEPVTLELRLESLNQAVVVRGTVTAAWAGECRRCLGPVTGRVEAEVQEIYERYPVDGETSALLVDRIDLEPLARETVLLELPLAPLCREDCAGLCPECGADRNTVDCGHAAGSADPRWGALAELRFEQE
jgi:uncharacterized protein